jgi:hypothetical protein
VRRNAAAGDVERGAARAAAGDDDAAARRSEGARVWRRRHMAGVVVVVVFSGRPSWRWGRWSGVDSGDAGVTAPGLGPAG